VSGRDETNGRQGTDPKSQCRAEVPEVDSSYAYPEYGSRNEYSETNETRVDTVSYCCFFLDKKPRRSVINRVSMGHDNATVLDHVTHRVDAVVVDQVGVARGVKDHKVGSLTDLD